MLLTEHQVERFWRKVDRSGDCWLWTAAMSPLGYGKFRVRPHTYLAHRVSFFLEHNMDFSPLCVLHACDTPRCVNPSHLFLGTHQDNMADMFKKGRAKFQYGHPRWACGERVVGSKMNETSVLEIRRLYAAGVQQRTIAARFAVCQGTVWKIVNRHSWAHVE